MNLKLSFRFNVLYQQNFDHMYFMKGPHPLGKLFVVCLSIKKYCVTFLLGTTI